MALWNLPSANWGEPATVGRSCRRLAPSAVGRPQAARTAQLTPPASAAAAVSAAVRRIIGTPPASPAGVVHGWAVVSSEERHRLGDTVPGDRRPGRLGAGDHLP